MSKENLKLTEWEIIHQIFHWTALKIQKTNENDYPAQNATNEQINNFSIIVSEKLSKYFASDHKNEITIPMPGSSGIKDYLNNKEAPNLKFNLNKSAKTIDMILYVNGPLVSGGENEEAIRINNLMQAIFATGALLDFFNIAGVYPKLFDFENTVLKNHEEFLSTKHIFSDDIINLSERISLPPNLTNTATEKYLNILNKLLNNDKHSSKILYALSWYCMSLDFNDIKTMFICRYISLEALSAIWIRTEKKNYAKQDALKLTISALLAEGVDDLKEKQESLNKIIKIRNKLFHGDENNKPHDKFNREIRQTYFELGILFKQLFLYTVNAL